MPSDPSQAADAATLAVDEGRAPVVSLHGDVDLSAVDAVRSVIGEALELADGSVVVDLSDVTFMDSSGLGLLVSAKDEGAARSVELVLRRISPAAQRILELAGTTDWFRVEPAE
ncbi:MAG: STAS domain-containing protein [Acidimicrobiales bacterium]